MRERDSLGSVEDLHASASKITGLDDFGSDDYLAPMRLLHDSLTKQGGLTGTGNTWHRSNLRGALAARLISEAGFAARPEHADVVIRRPIIVTGIRRSGTTMLQRLLQADPNAQGLEMWLTQLPQPRPPRAAWDDDPIYAAMKSGFQAHHDENPELAGVHFTHVDTPEECWQLLRQSFVTAAWPALAHVPDYGDFLRGPEVDHGPAYRRYKQNLQFIGLNDAEKRWVLKNPSHLGALDALMEVFPDALVIQTHRDPVVAVGSSCSLAEVSTRGYSTVYLGAQLGADTLEWLAWELEAFAASRAKHPQAQFIDVDYQDLVADPVATVAGIYRYFGIEWDDAVADAVTAEDAASRTGIRAPKHTYDLADFGLTADQVRERIPS